MNGGNQELAARYLTSKVCRPLLLYNINLQGVGTPRPETTMLDEIDRNILKELQTDARTSYAEMGRRVGLTTPAVIERVRKLEDAGVITGYRAEIDTAKIGLPITAFVRMSITGVDYSRIIAVAESTNEILECHRGTGGDSFIMKVAVASVEHLQEIIDKLTPYGITTTAIVLSSPVKSRILKV